MRKGKDPDMDMDPDPYLWQMDPDPDTQHCWEGLLFSDVAEYLQV